VRATLTVTFEQEKTRDAGGRTPSGGEGGAVWTVKKETRRLDRVSEYGRRAWRLIADANDLTDVRG
jgi:hypothetical protein